MNAVLKDVDKGQLSKKLLDRIEEIEARYESHLTALSAAITKAEKGGTGDRYAVRMAKWHREVADGLDAGEIKITHSGRLSGQPAKPAIGDVEVGEDLEQFYAYAGRYYGRIAWTLESLRQEKKNVMGQRDKEKQPLQAAVDLLDMSSGTTVDIDTADYHRLLD